MIISKSLRIGCQFLLYNIRAFLLCTVKGGVSLPQTEISAILKVHLSLFSLTRVFIGHLTLSLSFIGYLMLSYYPYAIHHFPRLLLLFSCLVGRRTALVPDRILLLLRLVGRSPNLAPDRILLFFCLVGRRTAIAPDFSLVFLI